MFIQPWLTAAAGTGVGTMAASRRVEIGSSVYSVQSSNANFSRSSRWLARDRLLHRSAH
jgi:hypothetical protein